MLTPRTIFHAPADSRAIPSSATPPPLIPRLPYCTIIGMDATVLIPIAFLVAGSIAIILTVYMYR